MTPCLHNSMADLQLNWQFGPKGSMGFYEIINNKGGESDCHWESHIGRKGCPWLDSAPVT